MASRDSSSEGTGLEGLRDWLAELHVRVDGGQPEGVGRCKVVASTSAVAFDEWRRSEGLETRTSRLKLLSAALRTGTSVHDKRPTNPHRLPVSWAFWNLLVLRVDSHDSGRGFADGASGDVLLDLGSSDVLHGHWHLLGSGQPVRVVVSRGNVALLVEVAEHEWHGAEHSWARTGGTEVLSVSSLVGLGEEKRVTVPELVGASWASWDGKLLGVTGEDEGVGDSHWTWWTLRTWLAVDTGWAG